MNKTATETACLTQQIVEKIGNPTCDVVICPPFTSLSVACLISDNSKVKVGAQNVSFAQSGAYTGEISADMLCDLGVSHVIIGHSERRQYFGETNETVNRRLLAAVNAGLTVILCVGETDSQREIGTTEEIIRTQIKGALFGVPREMMSSIIIAYEPVWAIGTGKTATADQAQAVCSMIRTTVCELYDRYISRKVLILYGGSMKPSNAVELLKQQDIDGGLIGGASLKAEEFCSIIAATKQDNN